MIWKKASKDFIQNILPFNYYQFPGIAENETEELLKNTEIIISPNDLKSLQTTNPAIMVCNRPIGNIEELLLHKALRKAGKEIIYTCPQIADFQEIFSGLETTDSLIQPKKNELAVSFPAGRISKFQSPAKSFADSKWDKNTLRKIYKMEADTIPAYIRCTNDSLNEWLGIIHPLMRSAYILKALKSGKKLTFKLKIGSPVKHREKKDFFNSNHFGRYLRARVYSLGSALHVKRYYFQPATAEKIIAPQHKGLLLEEIQALREGNKIGEEGRFEIFLSKAKKMPSIMHEIGRQREITFRAIGEGSNKAIDLDEFDLYYMHLFLWDKEDNQIVGAYRIGAGDYIMQSFGKKGFYLRSLFKIDDKMNPLLRESVELGRSFIIQEYQQQRLPLFLLWKGIYTYLQRYPHFKYIIGPVSISSRYSDLSLSLIKAFVEKHYADKKLSKLVKPRHKFKPNFHGVDSKTLIDETGNDTCKMDRLIADIEPDKLKLPVLLKKYFGQNAKIISFNVDPDFNQTLDGFMVCKIDELPADIVEQFSLDRKRMAG